MMEATNFPAPVTGIISQNPTVVKVTMAQYMAMGILVKPFSEPSTINITVPMIRTMVTTENKKIWILALLAFKALIKKSASETYRPSFSIRIILNKRNALITAKNWVFMTTKLR